MALNKNNLYASIFTLGVVALLLIAGPANAINLNLSSDKQTVVQGEDVSFNLTVDLTPYNELNVKHLKLTLDGPLTRNCLFDVNGTLISACNGIKNITKLSTNSSYGYGYGYSYGYGTNGLEYQIVLDTNDLPSGDYDVSVKAILKDNTEGDSNSKALKVNSKSSDSDSGNGGGKKKIVEEEETNKDFNPLSNSENPDSNNDELDLSGLENDGNDNGNDDNSNKILNFFKNFFKNLLNKFYSLF